MGNIIKLPDQPKKPSGGNKVAVVFLIILALLLIVGIVFVVKTLIPSKGKQTTVEETAKNVTLDDKSVTTFSLNSLSSNYFIAYKDGFANLNNDTLTFYKSDGSEGGILALNLNDPVYSVNDRYIALASRGGKDLKIVKDKKVVNQLTTDQEIKCVSINSRGYFSLVTDDEYYKNRLSVRDSHGEEIFAWLSADGYIVHCDISADGKKVYVTTLNSGDQYYTELIAFSVYDKEPLYRKKVPGHILVGSALLDNGDYLAIFDHECITLNNKGEEKKKYTYPSDYILKSYDYTTSGRVALSFSSSQKSHVVIMTTSALSGEPTDISVSGTITAIGLNENNLLAATTGKIYLLGFNGSTQRSISIEEYNINHILCYNTHRALMARTTSASIIPY